MSQRVRSFHAKLDGAHHSGFVRGSIDAPPPQTTRRTRSRGRGGATKFALKLVVVQFDHPVDERHEADRRGMPFDGFSVEAGQEYFFAR